MSDATDKPQKPLEQFFASENRHALFHDPEFRKRAMEAIVFELRSFLRSAPQLSNGGWPPISWQEIERFDYLVRALRDFHWERDPDNDPVLRWTFENRAYGWQPHIPTFPHAHKNDLSPEDFIQAYTRGIQALASGLEQALRLFELDLANMVDRMVLERDSQHWVKASEQKPHSIAAPVYLMYVALEPSRDPEKPPREVRKQRLALWTKPKDTEPGYWKIVGTDERVAENDALVWRYASEPSEQLLNEARTARRDHGRST